MTARPTSPDSELKAAIKAVHRPLWGVSAISCVGNVLMLTGPVFMMLVYNKVLSGKSVSTLLALSLLALLLYVFYGFLEGLRGKLMARVGIAFDHRIAPVLFGATLRLPLHFGPHAREHDPLQDLAAIRNYLMGPGPATLLDLPWVPLYYSILFLMHPLLGLAAAGGALFLVILSVVNQRMTADTAKAATRVHVATATLLQDARRNAEAAAAMSMGDDLCKRWGAGYKTSIVHARDLADQASVFGAISKTARLTLQSAMLALGAFLVIEGELSAGAMLSSSIILARALAPIDQIIGHWRGTSSAFAALKRLRALTARLPKATEQQHGMPKPHKSLSVRDVVIVPPGAAAPTVTGVSFEIEAGDALGIIGPSGSGKSTLVRALVGAWPVARGEVRFDAALLSHYSPEALAASIGHLPQSIELFDGTVGENIARFRKDATTEEIVEAARLAGVHEMILSFPKGYDTPVGEGGAILSGGQRQRIGLARAVFGNPFLVVLDEPNSNLDPLGEQSLNEAIQRLRQAGKIVIIVAHRPSAIFAANKILSLRSGRAEMFGAKAQVLTALFPRMGQPHKPAPVANDPAAAPAPAMAQGVAPAAPASVMAPGAGQALERTQRGVVSLDATRVRRAPDQAAG
ncbi:type I secretion system permease/ATPase [Chthonobacter rhizosphaerae]|uniref:type I secretion system permease/ATPase n=1 Tax=Chthonobacter rhizosphaerae TaxID=2735553 RepID=UPI0015EF6EF2|nr:type I secretion system permease/ATPase [Chthonobacter rhizosphaerae]